MNPTPADWKPTSAPVLSAAAASAAADGVEVEKLIAHLQSQYPNVRGEAWQGADSVGWSGVKPLAKLMTHQDLEIARAAKRAMWKIVRHAGCPKAEKERQAVQAELVALLKAPLATVQCEAAWMLSEIGDANSVQELARQLNEIEVREAARCALERMPGPKAIRALEQALKSAPEDFRPALASSLRARGRKVTDYPSQKLHPARKTTIETRS
jgi:HEAT repeat protein